MSDISMALGDYLEALVLLGGTPEKPVRSVDVANKLGISKPSVSSAVSTLKRKCLVDQQYRSGITLTERGYELGCGIVERHRIAERFLAEVLQLPDDQVQAESAFIKYAIQDESLPRWQEFVEREASLA